MNDNRTEWVCSHCGREAKVVRGTYRFTESGLKEVVLVGVELVRCAACGNEDPILPNIDGLMRRLAQAVIEKPWRLAGCEIRFLRKYLRMTGEQFGGYIGVDKWCVSKWENDRDVVGTVVQYQSARALIRGEGLQGSMERAIQMFPDIKQAMQEVEYRYNAETREVEYA